MKYDKLWKENNLIKQMNFFYVRLFRAKILENSLTLFFVPMFVFLELHLNKTYQMNTLLLNKVNNQSKSKQKKRQSLDTQQNNVFYLLHLIKKQCIILYN